MTADRPTRDEEERCRVAFTTAWGDRRCDLPTGHDGLHVRNDGCGRPEYVWRGGHEVSSPEDEPAAVAARPAGQEEQDGHLAPSSQVNREEPPPSSPVPETWRVGSHYGIHVYSGDRPVATFHRSEDAQRAVQAVNAAALDPSHPSPKETDR